MTQIVFEVLRAPSFYTANSAALALYASGRSTGVVLESGGQATRTLGVHEGLVMPHTVRRPSYAGEDLTAQLRRFLYERGYVSLMAEGLELVRDIKEKLSYVAEEASLEHVKFEGEKERGAEKGHGIEREYELPDGQIITMGLERFGVPEALFEESRLGLDDGSFQVHLWKSIQACDADLRWDMMRNIVLVCWTSRSSLSIGTVREADSVGHRLVETLCSLALPTDCRQ
jgi:actin-related protein